MNSIWFHSEAHRQEWCWYCLNSCIIHYMVHISQSDGSIIHLVVVSENSAPWLWWANNLNNRRVAWYAPIVYWISCLFTNLCLYIMHISEMKMTSQSISFNWHAFSDCNWHAFWQSSLSRVLKLPSLIWWMAVFAWHKTGTVAGTFLLDLRTANHDMLCRIWLIRKL